MNSIETFFILSLVVQFAHSLEELSTGFHSKWYLFKMPFWVFFLWEVAFTLFWVIVWITPSFPNREAFQAFFLVLMLANGIQHLVWWGCVKKYVPGLITAPIHIAVFLVFYYKVLL